MMAEEIKNAVNNEETHAEETTPAVEATEEKPEKAEWEIQLEKMLHNAYLKGIAMGGKTYVGVILDIIISGKKNRQNAAKILMKLENTCKRLLAVSDTYDKKNKTVNPENTTEEPTEQTDAPAETTDTNVEGGESVE